MKKHSKRKIRLLRKLFSTKKIWLSCIGLQENARMTVKEIAAKTHLSTTPVHERIKRMEAAV